MHPFSTRQVAAWTLAVLTGITASISAQPAFVRGDINLDGEVSFADIGFFLEAVFFNGPPPRCVDAVDVDDSGSVLTKNSPDAQHLLDWLFRAGPPPASPFPKPGPDPTQDPLGCADATVVPPKEAEGYAMAWEHDLYVYRGAANEEFFVAATTAGPITGFSLACRVDRRVLTNLRVDFAGTVFPKERRQTFENSPYFRARTVPLNDPRYDLLLVGAVFVEETPGPNLLGVSGLVRIPFAATLGAVTGVPLLRLVADVSASAPESAAPDAVLVPAEVSDLLPGIGETLHGLRNEFLAGQLRLPFPAGGFRQPLLVVEAGEFFRGDSNDDASRDLSDAVHTLHQLFLGGPASLCPDAVDSNDDGRIDIADPTFTLSFLFTGGRAPPSGLRGPAFCGGDTTEDTLPECLYRCRDAEP